MIKSVSLLVRKDGFTREAFERYWIEVHAPLVTKVPEMKRYVQHRFVQKKTRADIPPIGVELDGIAEVWYEDAAAMARAYATPEGKAMVADTPLFVGWMTSYVIEDQLSFP